MIDAHFPGKIRFQQDFYNIIYVTCHFKQFVEIVWTVCLCYVQCDGGGGLIHGQSLPLCWAALIDPVSWNWMVRLILNPAGLQGMGTVSMTGWAATSEAEEEKVFVMSEHVRSSLISLQISFVGISDLKLLKCNSEAQFECVLQTALPKTDGWCSEWSVVSAW